MLLGAERQMHFTWSKRTDACYLGQNDRYILFGAGRHLNIIWSIKMLVTWNMKMDVCYLEREVIWSIKKVCYLEYEDGCMLPGAGRPINVTWSMKTDDYYQEQKDRCMLPGIR
jgi:hypothetical protein